MTAKARQEQILEILKQQGYVTVKYLIEALQYSSATINRDLNALESRQLVIRSYGGVELVRSSYVPIPFRSHKMRAEKQHIGRAAAELVQDGDTIFIDGSTTAQCMAQHLLHRKELTVITNNMMLALDLASHGVKVVCLGGTVVEAPSMLCGIETVENAARYRVDKMFFATRAATATGLIASGDYYDPMLKTIAKNAGTIFYLVDHKKIDQPFSELYGDFGCVHYVISDHGFSAEVKAKFPHTTFISVQE
ncbi:MAG: DeoR/GlpR transcriptional regulator [Clostridia bacterium]|nr:DeoR/GlpR transcriptional regulator [Clostridia bacterium]